MRQIGDGGNSRIVRPAIVRCLEPGCGKEFEERVPSFMGFRYAIICPECRDRKAAEFDTHERTLREHSRAYRRQEWINQQVPFKYSENSFADFDASDGDNLNKVGKLQDYAVNFPVDERPLGYPSVLITRNINGVGKTHLACALLKAIIQRHADPTDQMCPYQFWPAPNIKIKLQGAQRYGSAETPEQVYTQFTRVRLLVIDDVGKEKLTEYDAGFLQEMYFGIINGRYNNGLPVVLTANLGFKPWPGSDIDLRDLVGSATVSRLMEMTGGIQYVIDGKDRR